MWVLGAPSARDRVPPPAISKAECGLSPLNGAAGDGLGTPRKGCPPPQHPASHPPGALLGSQPFHHCSSPASVTAPGFQGEM